MALSAKFSNPCSRLRVISSLIREEWNAFIRTENDRSAFGLLIGIFRSGDLSSHGCEKLGRIDGFAVNLGRPVAAKIDHDGLCPFFPFNGL